MHLSTRRHVKYLGGRLILFDLPGAGVWPRSWTERAYPKLIHYNRLPKGGHFAAWEQPQLLWQEVRDGLR